MARKTLEEGVEPANSFRFSLPGLMAFAICLIAGTAFSSYWIPARALPFSPEYSFAEQVIPDPDHQDETTFTRAGPWGELLMQNIQLERPVEYVVSEVQDIQPTTWSFSGTSLPQLKEWFSTNGLTAEQTDQALDESRIITKGNGILLHPSDDFIFSLSPQVRLKLYTSFLDRNVHHLIDFPYIFPGDNIETVYQSKRLHPEDVAVLKKLIFLRSNAHLLMDYETLIRNIPTKERRIAMTQTLSRQSAVLVRLCIRPDSDIDKIANYWGQMSNVRFTDIHPILQSLKELPNGGTISVAFLLPPFARERLYTFPLPPESGEPPMDCHWTTFNFSNRKADNQFSNPSFTVQFLQSNYYRIDAPTIYGDLILMMNDRNEIKHSAVYLADDLVYTKYGNNHTQPWMIVRIPDMQTAYSQLKPVYFRKKTS